MCMSDENTRRIETRQPGDGKASARVLEGPFPELKSTTLEAEVLDVSASGLRLDCEELLDQCSLELKISLNGSSEFVVLRGDVRWASWEEGSRYQMGVEFTGNDAPLVIKWGNILKGLGY
jgi:hypothetical protein